VAPVRFLAGWYEVLTLGVDTKLFRAILYYPLLFRVSNSLTALLIAGRLPIHFHQIPLQTLALPSAQISIPASTPPPCPALKHATCTPPFPTEGPTLLSGRSEGTTATNQPIRDSMSPPPTDVFPLFPLPLHYSLFLSFPFIFPLVEIPFSI